VTRVVHIALGSNLASAVGDRLATIAEALRRLAADGQIEIVARSSAYETDPVPPGQPMYLNAAAALRTALPLVELLERAQAVERSLGRVRRPDERWGPRTIDIDLLLDGESVVRAAGREGPSGNAGGLTVPHPRLAERTFVLVPLAEIAAEATVPPGRETVGSLLARLLPEQGAGTPMGLPEGIRRFGAIPT
jgi:2-amino-4-hydroxy-6-hydroxymethyldihydropteridine diphosphokinase